jgi:uncharacterized membrane protein (DUF4010 family)
MNAHLPPEIVGFAVALGCGLLIGIEREQHKIDHSEGLAVGVRTLALIAMAGATSAYMGQIAFALMGAFVALATVVSYVGTRQTDPGLTTEIATVLTFLIGALAMRSPALASGVAVICAILLQSKEWLHRFSKQVLTAQELNDALLLLASALVILPILPDMPLGPFAGLNVRRLWSLVVVVMSINALGYVAIRAVGPRLGLPISGLVGGFVSSAATVASMGHRAREQPQLLHGCAAGAMASNVSTLLLLAIIFAAVDAALLRAMTPSLILAGGLTLTFALYLSRNALRQIDVAGTTIASRPFHFGHALKFALLIALVLLIAAMLQRWLGSAGVTLTATVIGFADTHAPAISASEMLAAGSLDLAQTRLAILCALSANTVTKAIVAYTNGGLPYAKHIWPGLTVLLAGAWAGYFLEF